MVIDQGSLALQSRSVAAALRQPPLESSPPASSSGQCLPSSRGHCCACTAQATTVQLAGGAPVGVRWPPPVATGDCGCCRAKARASPCPRAVVVSVDTFEPPPLLMRGGPCS